MYGADETPPETGVLPDADTWVLPGADILVLMDLEVAAPSDSDPRGVADPYDARLALGLDSAVTMNPDPRIALSLDTGTMVLTNGELVTGLDSMLHPARDAT